MVRRRDGSTSGLPEPSLGRRRGPGVPCLRLRQVDVVVHAAQSRNHHRSPPMVPTCFASMCRHLGAPRLCGGAGVGAFACCPAARSTSPIAVTRGVARSVELSRRHQARRRGVSAALSVVWRSACCGSSFPFGPGQRIVSCPISSGVFARDGRSSSPRDGEGLRIAFDLCRRHRRGRRPLCRGLDWHDQCCVVSRGQPSSARGGDRYARRPASGLRDHRSREYPYRTAARSPEGTFRYGVLARRSRARSGMSSRIWRA